MPGDSPAQLAKASLKHKKVELAASLHGFCSEHFRWLLSEAVQELADLDHELEQVDKRLAKQLQPHADLILRLRTIPGVDFTTAAVIIAEIGLDMSRFPDAAHLASWAGLSPGNNESAGNATPVPRAKATGICEDSDAKRLVIAAQEGLPPYRPVSACVGERWSQEGGASVCASHADDRLAHYPGRHCL